MSLDLKRLLPKFRLALIVLPALLLLNCSPVKRTVTANLQTASTTEQQVSIEREVVTDSAATISARDVRRDRIDTSTTTEQASDEEVVTTTREYDTDKPVDPATGTPPLKRETTQTRRKVDAGRQEQTTSRTTDQQHDVTADVTKEQTVGTTVQGNSQHRGDTVTEVKTTEKRGLNTIQKVLCAIGGLTILVGLAWVAIKLKKRFYKPF